MIAKITFLNMYQIFHFSMRKEKLSFVQNLLK